jgi:hypothetical protein
MNAIRQQKLRKGGIGAPLHWDGEAATRIVKALVRAHHV